MGGACNLYPTHESCTSSCAAQFSTGHRPYRSAAWGLGIPVLKGRIEQDIYRQKVKIWERKQGFGIWVGPPKSLVGWIEKYQIRLAGQRSPMAAIERDKNTLKPKRATGKHIIVQMFND